MMQRWGNQLYRSCITVAEMLAQGLELPVDAFTRTIDEDMLYLTSTGVDLSKSKPGTVLTNFGRNSMLLTVQGNSRYDGVYTWTPKGERQELEIPEKHLLVQPGKQL